MPVSTPPSPSRPPLPAAALAPLAAWLLTAALSPAAAAQAPLAVTDLPYDDAHPDQLFDWYPAPGAVEPTPCAVYFHGGQGGTGDKSDVATGEGQMLALLLANGVSVMAINYHPFPEYIFPVQWQDGARAVQHFRAHADDYGIDPTRLLAWGNSGGAMVAGLLAYGPDFADPAGDPVEQQSSRPQAFMNFSGLADWSLMHGGYPGTGFGTPTLALTDPALLDEASFAWHVTHTPRAFTPPAASFYSATTSPPPLIDPHDATQMLAFHAALDDHLLAASDSIQLQREEGPPPPGAISKTWLLAHWAVQRLQVGQQLDLGQGSAGTAGEVPRLWAGGSFAPAGAFTFELQASLTQPVTAWLLAGSSHLGLPFQGGTLVPDSVLVLPLPTGAGGQLTAPGLVPPDALPGQAFLLQFWNADPAVPAGYAGSNAVLVVID